MLSDWNQSERRRFLGAIPALGNNLIPRQECNLKKVENVLDLGTTKGKRPHYLPRLNLVSKFALRNPAKQAHPE